MTETSDQGKTPDLDALRKRLAGQQAEFVAIMVGGADNTLGLDDTKLEAARGSLFSKRLSVLGGHFPGLQAGLKRARAEAAPAWDIARSWHTSHPPTEHDPDGASLLFQLARANELPPEAWADYISARVRYRTTDPARGNTQDVAPRRGPFFIRDPRGFTAVGWGTRVWIFERRMR